MRFLERYAAIALIMAVLMLEVHTVQAASEERIESIDVSVSAGSLPPAVGKRMEDSIRVIASQLMDGPSRLLRNLRSMTHLSYMKCLISCSWDIRSRM